MRRQLLAAAALAGLVAPVSAPAAELELGWFGTAEYDDNIFNTADGEGDKTDDVAIRTGPIIGLKQSQGGVTYELRYEPRYETFVDNSDLDEFDHAAFGRVRWQVDSTTTLTAVERFNLTHSLNRATFIGDSAFPDAAPDLDVEVARQELIQNAVSLELSHFFTPRLQGILTAGQSLFRSDREDRYDSDGYSGGARLLYTVTSKDQVGGGVTVSFQDFSDIENDVGEDTEGEDSIAYNLFATWIHTFDPTMTLSVQAGPTWIDTDRPDPEDSREVLTYPTRNVGGGFAFIDSRTCPTDDGVPFESSACRIFPFSYSGAAGAALSAANRPTTVFLDDDRDDGGEDLTYFAAVSLQKRWERWRVILSYNRRDSSASGVGQSTVLDVAALQLVWDPTPRWTLSFLAQASLRDQNVDNQVAVVGLAPAVLLGAPASRSITLRLVDSDSASEVTTYRAMLRVKRRIGRRAELFGQLTYLRQETDGGLDDRTLDNFRALFGARYMFDPLNVL
jgi:hypothetical protein